MTELALWSGTTWQGTQRRAEWASEMLWEQSNGAAGWFCTGRRIGEQRVLRLVYGVEIVAFGIGETIGEAVDHLRDGAGEPMTLMEAIARWGGQLPQHADLEKLRETARVTGKWPPHTPGLRCYACGGDLRKRGRR